jgi:hypothetical protein
VDARLSRIVCNIEQAGARYHKPSIIYLKKGMKREFDGEQIKPLPTEMEKELNQRIGIIDVDFEIALAD